MKKLMNAVEEKEVEKPVEISEGARPTYLLDRQENTSAKVLTNMLKQKRYRHLTIIGRRKQASGKYPFRR